MVVLFNHGEEPFKVNIGDRIAQLICERIYYPILQEVKSEASLLLTYFMALVSMRESNKPIQFYLLLANLIFL